MDAAPLPENEGARIGALRSLHILDTPPEERFDSLTRLAKRIFRVPIALVSLVDTDRQWFKSHPGLDMTGTPRSVSFCGHAILEDDVMVVPDTQKDERFRDSPLVVQEPHVRFYAGCPLELPAGHKVGTLCLMDTRARTLDAEELGLLRDLSRLASQELSATHLATVDELTHISNRRGFEYLAKRGLEACRHMEQPATLLSFDLDGFKSINDGHGHAAGDLALVTFADVLKASLREGDVAARLGGDEFAALLLFTDLEYAASLEQRIRQRLEAIAVETGTPYQVCFSMGSIAYDPARHPTVAALLAEADAAMYARKNDERRQRR